MVICTVPAAYTRVLSCRLFGWFLGMATSALWVPTGPGTGWLAPARLSPLMSNAKIPLLGQFSWASSGPFTTRPWPGTAQPSFSKESS